MPYKKSIKSDSRGKYIELTFISPVIGKKFKEKIKEISLKKNPSFNPSTLEVTLKICEEIDESIFKKVKEEFEYKTGCILI